MVNNIGSENIDKDDLVAEQDLTCSKFTLSSRFNK